MAHLTSAAALMVLGALLAVPAAQRTGTAQRGVELFGAGTISTDAPEFAISFTPDGREVYFNRASANRDTLTIMVSRGGPTRWSKAEVAPFSGTHRDVDPFVTADGSRLYFSSTRPRKGERSNSFNTWFVERVGDGWGEPREAGPGLNTDSTEVFVSLSADGKIAFSSNRDGASRIYIAAPRGSEWTDPQPVSLGVTTDAGNPLLHPNGRVMVVVRAGPDDRADLYASCRTPTGWSAPSRLPVNSRWADFAPGFDPGARYLYFTSERPGVVPSTPDGVRPPGDIYRVPVERLAIPCLDRR